MNGSKLLAVLLSSAGLGLIAFLLIPPSSSPALELLSSRQCLECHADVAKEWEESHHAFAYENPEVRKLSLDFQNEECLACHAPRPVLHSEPGTRVLARNSDRGFGVDCLACHSLPGGGVATSNPNPRSDAPCRPQNSTRMTAVESCAACHNQHKTVDQWEMAPEFLHGEVFKGDNCLHCHMPASPRTGGRMGSSHAFRASHDLESLQKAVTVDAAFAEGTLHISVSNFGAAHSFPTDERSRAADVQVKWLGTGEELWQDLYRFRDPYRDETHLQKTLLPAGETWTATETPPSQATGAEVRLLYKTQPFMSDDDAKVIAHIPVKW